MLLKKVTKNILIPWKKQLALLEKSKQWDEAIAMQIGANTVV